MSPYTETVELTEKGTYIFCCSGLNIGNSYSDTSSGFKITGCDIVIDPFNLYNYASVCFEHVMFGIVDVINDPKTIQASAYGFNSNRNSVAAITVLKLK